ncbi:PadR family transcriptional regulator [Salinibacterium sp. NK8237]|uniref:PadR family transcriptional regulator n=1 Tax=Salinibacterium sp. NK8237 TaxID=2792038 RepID=UPI0018CF58B9|nr:PadR family transcriptional regulator [Salinibacterium sp. NK8237]MBH0128964.1 PadR family transcriptional regulator [Salinibacterium sp. NK8237]
MNNSFGTSGRDSRRPFADAFDHAGKGLWDALDNVRSEFERRVVPRMGRGDVRVAILSLLAEESMHGYQIIREIDKRSNGAWKPSPGSVYPTLQLLADEGLIEAHEADGKKTYTLTEKGHDEAQAGRPAPWENSEAKDSSRPTALPHAAAKLAEAVVPLMRTGNPEQVEEAISVIDDARRKLYAILAQD